MASQKLFIDIVARDKATKALTGLRGGLARVRGAVFNLKTAFLGLGAGLVIRNLVNTGKNLENLQVRLKFLLKDTNEGTKAFQNMTKFAARVPFSLEQIQSGSGILATVTDNADDLQKMLEITGNVAATTGLDFRTTAEQIQRSFSAGIGAADLFREKGVRNMLGFKAGATVSIEETRKAFARVFGAGGQFGNSTDELAKTFEGTLSMIGDKIFNFKRVLLEAGLFEELKSQFGDLDNFLQNNAKELDRIATAVGKNLANALVRSVEIGKDLIPTLRTIGSILKSMIDGFMALPPFIQSMGIIGATMFGKRGFAVLVGTSILIDKIMDMTRAIKGSLGLFDENDLKDVQFRIDQIRQQIENIKKTDDLLDVEGGTVSNKAVENLEKELEFLEEKEEFLKKLQVLENAGFSMARERQIIRNATFKDETENVKTLFETLEELNNTALENLKNKLKDISTTIAEGLNAGISKFSNALARSIILGEDLGQAFKKMLQEALVSTLGLLIEIGIRMAILKFFGLDLNKVENKRLNIEKNITKEKAKQVALQALLLAMGGGGGGGGFFNIGGSHAQGGAVMKGRPILVGERGAEVFVPNSTGQIEQSARGSDGSPVNVNFNINTVDASGFEELLVNSRGTISQLINQALNEKGQGNLI
jgi:hypothetical protein